MKKVIFTIVALCIIGTSSMSAQAVWGARIGVSKPMLTISSDGYSDSWDGVFGLEVGPVLYYSIKNNFYLNTAAMFSIKTFKDDYDGESYKLNAYFVDIPLYAGYNFKLGKVGLYAQAGPYVGFKVAENEKYDGQTYTDDPMFSSIDAGLGFMAGVNIKRFKVELGYQLGLANTLNKAWRDGDDKMHINSLFLGVGFVF